MIWEGGGCYSVKWRCAGDWWYDIMRNEEQVAEGYHKHIGTGPQRCSQLILK